MTVPGFWSDVVTHPAGFRLITHGVNAILCYDEAGTLLWSQPIPEGMWYLRAAALADGTIACLGQGHDGGGTQILIVYPDGAAKHWARAQPFLWAQAIIEAADAETWRLAIQTGPATWAEAVLGRDGAWTPGPLQPVPTWPGGDGTTSQGFVQWWQGEALWADPNYVTRVNGVTMLRPYRAGDATLGQHPTAAGMLFADGLQTWQIAPTDLCFEPRLASDGTRYAVCARSDRGGAVWEVLTPPYALVPWPPPAEAVDLAPFPSHFYAACYKDAALKAPSNVIFAAEPLSAPITGPAIVGTFRKTLDFAIGWTLGIEDLEDASAAALACKAVKTLPVYAYVGGAVPEAIIDGIDYPLVQAYRGLGLETAALILARLRADLARCAYARVGLAVDLTDRTLPGVGGWPESDRVAFLVGLADLCREIQPAAVFAWAWDRREPQAGISSSAVVTEQWRRFVAAIPPAPVVPPLDPPHPPPPPEVPAMPPYDESLVFAFNRDVKAAYAEAGREVDAQYPVWIARTMYDYCAGMAWRLSAAKHLRELRAALGLAPVTPPF